MVIKDAVQDKGDACYGNKNESGDENERERENDDDHDSEDFGYVKSKINAKKRRRGRKP